MSITSAAAESAAYCVGKTGNTQTYSHDEYEAQKAEEFRRALEEVDSIIETPSERAKKRAEERKAQEARQDRQKRINELYSRLAQLRSLLSSKGGNDPGVEAQIGAVQTELFWLMFSF